MTFDGPDCARLVWVVGLGLLCAFVTPLATDPPSSDDESLMTKRTDGVRQVWLLRADGSGARQLTYSTMDKREAWFCDDPDFVRYETTSADVFVVDLETNVARVFVSAAFAARFGASFSSARRGAEGSGVAVSCGGERMVLAEITELAIPSWHPPFRRRLDAPVARSQTEGEVDG